LLFIRDSVLARNDIIEVLFPFRSKKLILKASIIRLEGREVAAKFTESPTRIEEFVEVFNREYKNIQAQYIQEEKKRNSVIVVDERDKFLERKREIDKLLDL